MCVCLIVAARGPANRKYFIFIHMCEHGPKKKHTHPNDRTKFYPTEANKKKTQRTNGEGRRRLCYEYHIRYGIDLCAVRRMVSHGRHLCRLVVVRSKRNQIRLCRVSSTHTITEIHCDFMRSVVGVVVAILIVFV